MRYLKFRNILILLEVQETGEGERLPLRVAWWPGERSPRPRWNLKMHPLAK